MAEIRLELTTDVLRDSTGLIKGMRLRCDNRWAKLDLWLWLDRETDAVAELKPYQFGMRGAPHRG